MSPRVRLLESTECLAQKLTVGSVLDNALEKNMFNNFRNEKTRLVVMAEAYRMSGTILTAKQYK